jgi:hypothetical protein
MRLRRRKQTPVGGPTATPWEGDANDPKETFIPANDFITEQEINGLVTYVGEARSRTDNLRDLVYELHAYVLTLRATVIDLNKRLMELEGDEYEDDDE